MCTYIYMYVYVHIAPGGAGGLRELRGPEAR